MTDAPPSDDRNARSRNVGWPPVVAWALLIGGYAILWISVTIRAVRAQRLSIDRATGQIDPGSMSEATFIGWECVLRHTYTQPMNAALAALPLAYILWRTRGWSGWKWSSLVVCALAFIIQALLFITRWADARTTLLEIHEGFALWVLGPLVIAAAFLVAPPPFRVDPDSGERVFSRTSGLRDWALGLWGLAILAFQGSHFLPARDPGPDDSGWALLALYPPTWIVDAAILGVVAATGLAIRDGERTWRRIGLGVGMVALVTQLVGPLFLDAPDAKRLIIGWYVWWASTLTLLIALAICPTAKDPPQANAS